MTDLVQLPDTLYNVHSGWHGIIRRTHEKLLAVVPNYEVFQVKEKWGALRIYLELDVELTTEQLDTIDEILQEAEQESEETCEFCGNPGRARETKTLWLKTTCDDCEEE